MSQIETEEVMVSSVGRPDPPSGPANEESESKGQLLSSIKDIREFFSMRGIPLAPKLNLNKLLVKYRLLMFNDAMGHLHPDQLEIVMGNLGIECPHRKDRQHGAFLKYFKSMPAKQDQIIQHLMYLTSKEDSPQAEGMDTETSIDQTESSQYASAPEILSSADNASTLYASAESSLYVTPPSPASSFFSCCPEEQGSTQSASQTFNDILMDAPPIDPSVIFDTDNVLDADDSDSDSDSTFNTWLAAVRKNDNTVEIPPLGLFSFAQMRDLAKVLGVSLTQSDKQNYSVRNLNTVANALLVHYMKNIPLNVVNTLLDFYKLKPHSGINRRFLQVSGHFKSSAAHIKTEMLNFLVEHWREASAASRLPEGGGQQGERDRGCLLPTPCKPVTAPKAKPDGEELKTVEECAVILERQRKERLRCQLAQYNVLPAADRPDLPPAQVEDHVADSWGNLEDMDDILSMMCQVEEGDEDACSLRTDTESQASSRQVTSLSFLSSNSFHHPTQVFVDPEIEQMSQGTILPEPFDTQDLPSSQASSYMDNLSQATSSLSIDNDPNPILEAGKRVYEQLNNMQLEVCAMCKEKFFDLQVGPRTGRCKSCSDYVHNHRHHPAIFSHENLMDPGVQPEVLAVLNRVERAAIARISPLQNIIKLRGGNLAQRGHSISFLQDISGFARKLPKGQENLPFIIIRSPNQEVPLMANRIKILAALEWLIANNPEYHDVIIDQEVLQTYPNDNTTSLTGVRHIDTEEPVMRETITSIVRDSTAGDKDNTVQDTMEDIPDLDINPSLVPGEMPTNTVNDSIRRAILSTNAADTTKEYLWPERSDRPASEFLPGFFSK